MRSHTRPNISFNMPITIRIFRFLQFFEKIARAMQRWRVFFAALKSGLFYLNKSSDVDALQIGIKKYIHYYNHERINVKPYGLNPAQYRPQP